MGKPTLVIRVVIALVSIVLLLYKNSEKRFPMMIIAYGLTFVKGYGII
nr:MAG TPA: hypothetical protein [Caudoviricetes sp.]